MRYMRRVSVVALVACLLGGASAAGASGRSPVRSPLRHRLVIGEPTVTVGETEHVKEVVLNDSERTINVSVWWLLSFPCGGGIVGDPYAQTIDPGARAVWRLQWTPQADCAGLYRVRASVGDPGGTVSDAGRFTATG